MKRPVKTNTVIYYVDDDQDDLEYFQMAIDAIGESVTLFDIPEHMLLALEQPLPKPLLLFLDLNMASKSGLQILDEIKQSENLKDLPTIIYSTAAAASIIETCYQFGASMYIVKPTSLIALQKAISHVIGVDWRNFKPSLRNFLYKP